MGGFGLKVLDFLNGQKPPLKCCIHTLNPNPIGQDSSARHGGSAVCSGELSVEAAPPWEAGKLYSWLFLGRCLPIM